MMNNNLFFTALCALLLLTSCGDKRSQEAATDVTPQAEKPLTETEKEKGAKLVEKAAAGKLSEVKELLASGAPINFLHRPTNTLNVNGTPVRYGVTALHVAAIGGYKEVVQHLVNQGADMTIRSERGPMALTAALLKADAEVANVLIAAGNMADVGADINAQFLLQATTWTKKDTANLEAADAARARILNTIGQKKPTIDLTKVSADFPHHPILSVATVSTAMNQTARKLLALGVPMDVVNPITGDSALHIAVQTVMKLDVSKPLPESSILNVLLAAGIKTDIKNKENKTALDLVFKMPASRLRGEMINAIRKTGQ